MDFSGPNKDTIFKAVTLAGKTVTLDPVTANQQLRQDGGLLLPNCTSLYDIEPTLDECFERQGLNRTIFNFGELDIGDTFTAVKPQLLFHKVNLVPIEKRKF